MIYAAHLPLLDPFQVAGLVLKDIRTVSRQDQDETLGVVLGHIQTFFADREGYEICSSDPLTKHFRKKWEEALSLNPDLTLGEFQTSYNPEYLDHEWDVRLPRIEFAVYKDEVVVGSFYIQNLTILPNSDGAPTVEGYPFPVFETSDGFDPHDEVYGILDYVLSNPLVFKELGVPFNFTALKFPTDDEKFHWVGDIGGDGVIDSLSNKYQLHRDSEGVPFRVDLWPSLP